MPRVEEGVHDESSKKSGQNSPSHSRNFRTSSQERPFITPKEGTQGEDKYRLLTAETNDRTPPRYCSDAWKSFPS